CSFLNALKKEVLYFGVLSPDVFSSPYPLQRGTLSYCHSFCHPVRILVEGRLSTNYNTPLPLSRGEYLQKKSPLKGIGG
ncbi:MAG: hypothetical protein LPK14_14950, partial [Hymenobacteraceae bacterium]|nr:hypothetical protein [Hymenobacteraceae bacterium]